MVLCDEDIARIVMEEQLSATTDVASSIVSLAPRKKAPKKKRDHSALRKAPGAPKRFKSSYICFFMYKQQEIKEELGDTATVSEVSKRSAELWRSLPVDERAHWDDVAAKDKQRYMVEKATYTGPWQVPWKRAKKDPSAPKRPMSAFLYFSQAKRAQLKVNFPNLRNTDVSRKLGDLWRSAPEEERAPHIAREKVEREKYKIQMAEWRKDHEEKLDEQRRAHAKAQVDHSAQLASVYSTGSENAMPNDQDQSQYSFPSGGYGEPNMMQQQPQYMGQQYSYHGHSGAYPQYNYGGYPQGLNAPQGFFNGRPVMVLGPNGMPAYQPAYGGIPDHSTGHSYDGGGASQPHYGDTSDYPSQE